MTDEVREVQAKPAPRGTIVSEEVVGKQVTLWSDAYARFKKNRLAMFGLAIVLVVILVAILAEVIAPYDPLAIESRTMVENSLLSPSPRHLMGTDILGRDVFSRIVFGSRVSLQVGIIAVSIMIFLGLIAGAVAGYYGGIWDNVIMRFADVFFAFPYILGAIALIAVLGYGFRNVFIAIGILGWPFIARVFRSTVLSVKENEFVEAARALGAGDFRIITRHILPNAVAPVIVYGTMSVGGAIITEAALSFLGIGVQPPMPAWGYMLAESRTYIFTAPWLMYFPGLAIVITVLGFVLLGDGLRDALDPRLRE
jgi:peptide/nickel transport system permease protein/oligopeptide transport system permease protein